jgi:hypothetical protein
MGFTGLFVLARSVRPLAELPEVRAAGGEAVWTATEGDWQLVQILKGEDVDAGLAVATGGPVLVAHVIDSDWVVVEAHGPVWQCVLARESASDYGVPDEQLDFDVEDVVIQAQSWAVACGRQPDRAALLAVLEDESAVEAGDLVIDLTTALGFHLTG